MKNLDFAICGFVLFTFIYEPIRSQNTFIHWISTPMDESFGDICTTGDGGFVFFIAQGKPAPESPNFDDFFKLKHHNIYLADNYFSITDSLTVKSVGGYEVFFQKVFSTEASYILSGIAYDTVSEDYQYCMIWLNHNLELFKYELYGLPDQNEFTMDVILNNSGNIVCHGLINPDFLNMDNQDSYIHYFWEFDLNGNQVQYVTDTLPHNLGGLVAIGSLDAYHMMGDGKIFQLSNSFAVDTLFNFSLMNSAIFYIVPYNEYSYLMAGETIVMNGDVDLFFLQTDFNTNVLNFNSYGTLDTLDRIGHLSFYNYDTIFMGGSKNFYMGQVDTWFSIYKTNVQGEIFFERYYGEYGKYALTKLLALEDGGCILAGTWWDFYNYPTPGNQRKDVVIMKVDGNGLITGINDPEIPFDLRKVSAYPNPFSDIIHFVTGFHSNLDLLIYSANGRVVHRQLLHHNTSIDLSSLPSGIYFYNLTGTDGFFESGKIIKQ
jgi:hypothetical protein